MPLSVSIGIGLIFMLALGLALGLIIAWRGTAAIGDTVARTARGVKRISVFAGDIGKPYGQCFIEVDGEPYNVTVEPRPKQDSDAQS